MASRSRPSRRATSACSPAVRSRSSGRRTLRTATTRPTSRSRAASRPREFAQALAGRVVELPSVERAEVAGPGFLNLWVSDAFLGELLDEIDRDYGGGWAEEPERVQVEMVSANPTGPLTVASARNAAYGDSVARLLEFAGHDVTREYYWNDAGRQMDLFRASVEAFATRGGPARRGLPGRVHRRPRRRARRPGARDARADRGDSRALPRALRLLGSRGRARPGDPGRDRADRDVRVRGHALGADDRARRRQGPSAPAVGRRQPSLLRGRRRLPAAQARPLRRVRSTSSARTTTGTSRG